LIERFSKRSKQRDIAVKRAGNDWRKLTEKSPTSCTGLGQGRSGSLPDVRNQQLVNWGFRTPGIAEDRARRQLSVGLPCDRRTEARRSTTPSPTSLSANRSPGAQDPGSGPGQECGQLTFLPCDNASGTP
jgi:hypothetical protein